MQWIKRVFGEAARRQEETGVSQPTLIMALEPRMMFDGAVAATAAEVAKPTDAQDAAADKAGASSASKENADSSHAATGDARSDAGQGAQAGSGRNVVFVDSRVEDAQQLLQGVAANTDVVFLDSRGNGVEQMAQYLSAHPGAASVQIIAHGNAGDLWLGNSYVSAENIANYGNSLSQLGASMQAGGDILIYACNTAQGERGQTFVDELASLTGRDIAASDDRTGNGSDWDLEVTTGAIEARPVLSTAAEVAYQHSLAIITVTTNNDSGADLTFGANQAADLSDGSGLSLREAINWAASGDTIKFAPGLSGTTIALNGHAAGDSLLVIAKSLTIEGDIDGNGTADITLDGQYNGRVLEIKAGTVNLDGLIVQRGLVSGKGGDGGTAPGVDGTQGGDALGAGILVSGGTANISHSIIRYNVAAAGGGGSGYSAPQYTSYGGGGGGGFNNKGGGAGGGGYWKAGDPSTGNGIGTNGQGGPLGGVGGSNAGGLGGDYVGTPGFDYFKGGDGATATNTLGSVGGGGGAGGYGQSGTALAAKGGSAAGGLAIAAGATVNLSTTSFVSNLAAGGGGSAGSSVTDGTVGGDAAGAILVSGMLHYQSSSVTFNDNVGVGGGGGESSAGDAVAGLSLSTVGAARDTLGTVDAAYVPPVYPTVSDSFISIGGGTGTGGAYRINDTVTVTWNNSSSGDNNAGITSVTVDFSQFGGGSAVAANNSGGVWTATYTITAGAIDAANRNVAVTAVNADGPTTRADSSNATVDNIAPSVSDARISISGGSGIGGAYRIGDTLTATWNNTAAGDNNSDAISSVTFDLSQFGGGSAVSAVNSGGVWTATYIITAGSIDAANRNVSVTVTDNAGNRTTTADSSNVRVDNIAPTVNAAAISLAGATGSGGTFHIGDTVTASWDASANSDTIGSVTVDFSQFGGGSSVAAARSGNIWTATYTIVAGSIDATNRNVTVTAVDDAGNAISTSGTANASVDNIAAVVSDVQISLSGASQGAQTYAVGDTVTARWDNSASGDNNSDTISSVTFDFSQFGGGSAVAASNVAGVWTAQYTLVSGVASGTNLNVSVNVTDNAGNLTRVAGTSDASIVTQPPVVISSGGSASFFEGDNTAGTPVAVDSGLTLSDPDSGTLAGATVSITGNFHAGEDVLSFVNDGSTMGNIVASYDASTGVLHLTSSGASATLAQWQAALRSVTYTDTAVSPNTSTRTVAFAVNDGSNSSGAATRTITVSNVNDTPVIHSPSQPVQVYEDSLVPLNTISFSDEDSGSGSVTVTFSTVYGSLIATSGAGVTVGGTATTLTLTGSIANINTFIASSRLSYVTAANDTGSRQITVNINDLGNSGSGGAKSASSTISVEITPINDAPLISAPAGIVFNEDVDLRLTSISFSDPDAGSGTMTVTFSVPRGILAATGGAGVTVSGGGSGQVVLSGSLADINAFVAGGNLTYRPQSNFNGSVALSIGINDNGNGGSGPGDALSSTQQVSLTINAVNDAPVNSVPASASVDQNSTLYFSQGNGNPISVSDVDVDGGVVRVTLTASNGLLTLSRTSGLTFRTGSGSGDAMLVVEGSLADINAALNGLAFSPTPGFNGAASIQIVSQDLGQTGAGGPLTDTDTINVTVNSISPRVTDVSAQSPSGTYKVGDTINVVVSFDQSVYVDTTAGTPALLLETGVLDRLASYVSGSGSNTLIFSYVVQAGDLSADLDVNSSVALSLNGGSIRNAASDVAILTLSTPGSAGSLGANKDIVIDGVAPVVGSVSVPSNGTYLSGQTLDFTVNLSEAVIVNGTPGLTLDIGGQSVFATYLSGSGTNALVFRLTVQNGQLDANGISVGSSLALNGGSVTDAAGNNVLTTLNNVGSTVGVLVDAAPPSIASVDVPANGSYRVGSVLSFTVNTSEAVLVVTAGGTPRLALDVGGRTVYADYVSGSGSSALVFQYQVQAGDNDANGIQVLGLQANGASLRDAATNSANLALNGVADTQQVLVDTTAPSVASVGVPADGSYKSGDLLSFTVNTSEGVLVDTTGGTPRLALTIGSSTVYADYVSGSGSTELVFQYRIQAGESDTDGIAVGALQANGGSLRDAAGNDANLAVSNIGSTANVLVDTTAPTATTIVRVDGSPTNAGQVDFDVSFSEPVSGVDANAFVLQASGSATGQILSVTRLGEQTWRVSVGNLRGDGDLSLVLQGNSRVQDAAGNGLQQGQQGPAYTLDHSSPQVSAVQLPADGRFTPGQTLNFGVDFSEAVVVDTRGGIPHIAITLDQGGTVYADYVSGSGTSHLVFAYTVASGQADNNGIQLGDSILANGASLTDAVGNAAQLALGSLPSTRGLLVQGALSDGDPQYRAEQGIQPVVTVASANSGNAPQVPSPLQNAGPPALGQAPLIDSSNRGSAQSALGSLFREGPSQTQFALIFSNNSNSAFGDGSGSGFLGFGGGDAGVFGSSTLGAIFDAAREGDEQALSAFGQRHGDIGGGLSGVFAGAGLGQQLQEMNQREQRQVADLARAFGELGQDRPAS